LKTQALKLKFNMYYMFRFDPISCHHHVLHFEHIEEECYYTIKIS